MSFTWMDKPLSEFILLLLKATMVDHFLLENTPKIISVLSGFKWCFYETIRLQA